MSNRSSVAILFAILLSLLVEGCAPTANLPELPLSIVGLEFTIMPADTSLETFNIQETLIIAEDKSNLDVSGYRKLLSSVDQQRFTTNPHNVISTRLGLALRMVKFDPFDEGLEIQFPDGTELHIESRTTLILTYPNGIPMKGRFCCSTNFIPRVRLNNLPLGSFNEAGGAVYDRWSTSTSDKENFSWMLDQKQNSVSFSYIPPPFNRFSQPVLALTRLYSINPFILVLLGMIMAVLLIPMVRHLRVVADEAVRVLSYRLTKRRKGVKGS